VSSPGSRRDHDRFCKVEQWAEVRNARGKKVGHHVTYELELPDDSILRTRVSRPANNTTYGASLWNLILTEQLCVSEQEFWECVSNQNPPQARVQCRRDPSGGTASTASPPTHPRRRGPGKRDRRHDSAARDRAHDRVLVPAEVVGRGHS